MAHRSQRQVSWGETRSFYKASRGYVNQRNQFSVTHRGSEPGTCSFRGYCFPKARAESLANCSIVRGALPVTRGKSSVITSPQLSL